MRRNLETGEKLAILEKQLHTYAGKDQMVDSRSLWAKLKDEIDNIPKYKTGLPSLDRLMGGGIEAGEVFVLTGLPGDGKTSLLASLTPFLASQTNVAWFQLEMKAAKLLRQMAGSMKEVPMFYLPADNSEKNVKWLCDRMIEAYTKYDCRVVMIDHIHELISLETVRGEGNASLEIGDIVAYIKEIAEQFGLCVFLIAHCVDNKTTKHAPTMQDIRDSGMISRYADAVAAVWRIPNDVVGDEKKMKEDKIYPTDEADIFAKMRVYKNRREGTRGYLILKCENHFFTEYDTRNIGLIKSIKKDEDWIGI